MNRVILIAVVSLSFLVEGCHFKEKSTFQYNSGVIFHTTYNIQYAHQEDLGEEIVAELHKFDGVFSMFNDTSMISRINRNDTTVLLNEWAKRVLSCATKVSTLTDGAFDITVAPLVNAWGFGYKKRKLITQKKLDSLLKFVGYQKLKVVNNKIVKEDDRLIVDMSAVAKGFACDVIADLLERHNIADYLVEIGGELDTKGLNPKGEKWRIGINKPIEDSLCSNELIAILALNNVAMATSGNYRNFYIKDGKKYAHTIDPHSGRPVQHSLLSATVLAENCMRADALATSFMVLGLEKSLQLVNQDTTIEAYFIYADKEGKNQIKYSKGLKKYLFKEFVEK